jgi:tripartite motif-containing protein 71
LLIEPVAVAIDRFSGNLYVVEAEEGIVKKFTVDGELITKWTSQLEEQNNGQTPASLTDIAVDSSGNNVYLVDRDSNRVQKFDSNGNFITKWGSEDGQFQLLNGIAIDSAGNVYVADTGNNRVQKFDSNGNFITKFGSMCQLFASEQNGCIDPDGAGPLSLGDGQFMLPQGITVDASGKVYVADTGNSRIQVFSPATSR